MEAKQPALQIVAYPVEPQHHSQVICLYVFSGTRSISTVPAVLTETPFSSAVSGFSGCARWRISVTVGIGVAKDIVTQGLFLGVGTQRLSLGSVTKLLP